MDKRNRPALGFLLVGVGLAGRALMGVPQATGIAELTLTILMLVGYLVLVQQLRLPILLGAATAVLELVLCGSGMDSTSLSFILLRQADLWLMYAAVELTLRCAKALCPTLYGSRIGCIFPLSATLLALQSLAQLAAHFMPQLAMLPVAAMGLFVAFSVSLLMFTILLVRAYNALRVKKERRRQL